jgi:hypothetical protein
MSETEDDLILGEADYTLSDLIDNQLTVITTLLDIEVIAYDTFEEDRIKAIAQAMKMIHKCQRVLMSNI